MFFLQHEVIVEILSRYIIYFHSPLPLPRRTSSATSSKISLLEYSQNKCLRLGTHLQNVLPHARRVTNIARLCLLPNFLTAWRSCVIQYNRWYCAYSNMLLISKRIVYSWLYKCVMYTSFSILWFDFELMTLMLSARTSRPGITAKPPPNF